MKILEKIGIGAIIAGVYVLLIVACIVMSPFLAWTLLVEPDSSTQSNALGRL